MKLTVIILVSILFVTFCILWIKYISHLNDTIVFPRHSTIELAQSTKFIKCLRQIVSRNRKILRLDFKKVEVFPYESYLVISAQTEKANDLCKKKSSKKVYIVSSTGKLSSMVLRTLMINPQETKTYHQHVVGGESTFIQHSQITTDLVKSVETELKKIGIRNYYDINTMVTEIIGNAIEHGIKGQNINWWMHHSTKKGILKLVFVDMGIGIATSYRKAGIGWFKPDGYLLKKALMGKIGSSTKKPNRGKGLPQMDLMVRNNFISNFLLITNNVTLRYINGEYVATKNPNFIGTYYSWTINKENFSKWQTWSTSQKTIAES